MLKIYIVQSQNMFDARCISLLSQKCARLKAGRPERTLRVRERASNVKQEYVEMLLFMKYNLRFLKFRY